MARGLAVLAAAASVVGLAAAAAAACTAGAGAGACGLAREEALAGEAKPLSLLQLASDAAGVGSRSRWRLNSGSAPGPTSDLQHHWPHPRGRTPNDYATTHLVGPANLTSALAWSWSHPKGRFYTTVAGGPVIDYEMNVYLVTNDGLRKFNTSGQTVWHYQPPGDMSNSPCLLGGSVFGVTNNGHAFALDIRTGEPLWLHKYAEDSGPDVGYPAAHAGRYIFGMDEGHDPVIEGGSTRVIAVNVTDGDKLWEFHPDKPVWNLTPVFPDNASVMFMDFSGGAYRLALADGGLIWHTPPPPASMQSFSDGGLMVASNGLAYTCSNAGKGTGQEGSRGVVRALSIADGTEIWSQVLPMPCNSWAAVGDAGADALSVVLTVGSFPGFPGMRRSPHHGGVMALDAGSGQLQWHFQAPTYWEPAAAGDSEGLATRLVVDTQHAICLPGPWTAPTIAGDGTVYAGYMDGYLYAVHGPPKSQLLNSREIPRTLELSTTSQVRVQRFKTGAGFLHGGTAWAPGMMAVATCDSLFVFRF